MAVYFNSTPDVIKNRCWANYDNWGSANLHYGLLGQMLCDELSLNLHLATHAIATEKENGTGKGEWLWIIRPAVAEAVEYLGLNE